MLKALIIGDIVGDTGMRAIFLAMDSLKKKYNPDLIIINGENAHSNGLGLTPEITVKLFNLGAHVITTGNHVWNEESIYPILEKEDRILRPHNYDEDLPGKGYAQVKIKDSLVTVINLQGREQMAYVDNPFKIADKLVKRFSKNSKVIIVDFHAESTMEKEALAFALDGQITALVGTHTHIPTADERILPKKTAYVTDLGMTGPLNSVIGSNPESSIQRFTTLIPVKNEVLDEESIVNGVFLEIDEVKGHALSIQRINYGKKN